MWYPKYLVLYIDFLEILKTLSGGALSLYILIGLLANHSGNCDADSLLYMMKANFAERSIEKWITELRKKKLIHYYKSKEEKRFFICPYNSEEYKMLDNDEKDVLRQKYMDWISDRMKRSDENKVIYKFFIIPDTFADYIRDLKPDAIKLYIYCGLSMNLSNGFLTQSLGQISKGLGFSIRKIEYCFAELKAKKLIHRQQLRLNEYSYTYLLPLKINFKI